MCQIFAARSCRPASRLLYGEEAVLGAAAGDLLARLGVQAGIVRLQAVVTFILPEGAAVQAELDKVVQEEISECNGTQPTQDRFSQFHKNCASNCFQPSGT